MLTELSDREALIAILGGLLTLPDFAEFTPALGVVSERVLALDQAAHVDRSQSAIRRMVARAVAELNSPDRMPNPFSDLLVTAFGSATVRCAFADDSVRDAEVLIDSVLGADGDLVRAEGLTRAALGLMGEVASRSQWRLYDPPAETVPDLPEDERLMQLAGRVTFDAATLTRVCGASWAETLAPLAFDDEPGRSRERPLLRSRSGSVVLARPEALAGALAFALAQRAYESDDGEALDEAFSLLSAHRALSSIAELGSRHMRPAPNVRSPFAHSSSLVFLDIDAVLHVMVLTVDLTLGVPPPGSYWKPPVGEDIPPHLDAVEQRIRNEAAHVETVVHLIVLEGAGAQPMLHLDRPANTVSPHMVLTGSELEWLARHPDTTPRDLAAFAHDLTELRSRVNYFSTSQLDDFQAWRSDALGFTKIEAAAGEEFQQVVMGAGLGRDLRLEVTERFEPQVAPAPDGNGEWRIARSLAYGDVELWRPWGSPDWPAHFFVPGIGHGVWVLDAIDQDPGEHEDETWDVRRKHTELVAYWLWRLQDQLPQLSAAANRRSAPLQVRMTIEITDVDMALERELKAPAFDVTPTADGADVTVHPRALEELGGPDAAPEHAYILRVLQALSASVGATEPHVLGFPAQLRKLIYLRSANPAIRPSGVVDGRVHPSYRTRVHRLVGTRIMVERNIAPGEIPAETTNSVLKRAVEILQEDLERQLDDLRASQVLLLLMGTYERLVHDRAIADIELAAIDEFFGHHADAAQSRIDDFGALNQSSIACRYLIELTAAKPPRGSRLVSDHAIQSLLAAALAIVHFGRISDLIHLQLTREAMTVMLPPGVLMATARDYVEAHDLFATAVRRGDVERSAAQRDAMLRGEPHSKGSPNSPSGSAQHTSPIMAARSTTSD